MTQPQILIAGMGNVLRGDDAFGVEVVRCLSVRRQPKGVQVADFGIRDFDLAAALMNGVDLAILIDAMPRGELPGTLYVLGSDASLLDEPELMDKTHRIYLANVLQLVHSCGGHLPLMRVVGCEPAPSGTDDEPTMGLSRPVRVAVADAIQVVESLVAEFLDDQLAVAYEGGNPRVCSKIIL